MAKKIALKEIGETLTHVVKHMAAKEDVAEIRNEMATKDQVYSLQTQVSSIERQLREAKMEVRLADLEDEMFGASKSTSRTLTA